MFKEKLLSTTKEGKLEFVLFGYLDETNGISNNKETRRMTSKATVCDGKEHVVGLRYDTSEQ